MGRMIQGKVLKLGDNINTDYIVPARYLDLYEPEELGPHAFEAYGDYREKVQGRSIVVGGENFGLGSAREQAPNALKGAGIAAVVAKSFARIFYRNAINLGLPLVECDTDPISEGDILRIDLAQGQVYDETRGLALRANPLPEFMVMLLNEGGMVEYLRKYKKFSVPGAAGKKGS